MSDAYGLFPTPHRKAFLRAVGSKRNRIVRYHSTGEAWDDAAGVKVTARLEEAFSAGWIEPVPEAELWANAQPKAILSYFRLTAAGRVAAGLDTSSSSEKEVRNG